MYTQPQQARSARGVVSQFGGNQNVGMGGSGSGTMPPNFANQIQNMLSQGSGQNQVPAINNTSVVNPQAQEANNILMQRAQGDMGAADAMRLSGIANADQAAMLMADAGKNASRRGVGGTGAPQLMKTNIANNALRSQAGENSRIAFNSERAKDDQFTNVRGGALQQDAAQNDQRRLANDQYNTAQNAALAQQRMQMEKLNSLLGILSGQGMF